LHQEVF